MTYYLISSLCLLAFCLIYELFLKADKLMNLQRTYLLLAVVASLTIPLVEVDWNPNNYLQAVENYLPASAAENNELAENSGARVGTFSWHTVAIVTYFLGVCLMLLRTSLTCNNLIKIIRYGKIVKTEDVSLVYTQANIPVSSFFRYVFISKQEQFSEEEFRSILADERKHYKDRHSIDIVLLECMKIVFWFNPAVYLIDRALKSIHEYVSDNEAIKHCDVSNYEHLLVSTLFRKVNMPLVSQFSEVSVKKRIIMLNQKSPNFMKKVKFLLFIPLTLALVWACDNSEINTFEESKSHQITGRVFNEEGNPLPGVNIVVQGTQTGTVSDITGNYKLNVPTGDKTIVYAFIGLETQTQPISGREVIDVEMKDE